MEMPQFSEEEGLGWIFCRRREKHPILLQNKQNRGCDGSSSHQGQQALWGPRSWRRDGGREDVAAEGCASSSLRCFQSTPRCRWVKVITLQLKTKMSLGRELRHSGSLWDMQAKEGEGTALSYQCKYLSDLCKMSHVNVCVENCKIY